MNENQFENEQNFDQTPSYDAQKTDCETDFDTDEAATAKDKGFFGSAASEYDVTAEKINIPEEPGPSLKHQGKGIKVFCLALACVIVLSSFAVGGYIMGRHSNSLLEEDKSYDEPNLADRPKEGALTTAEIYENVADSVVGILIYNDDGDMSYASGVVYSESGYIISNDHIYTSIPAAKFKVYLHDGSEYNAYFVAGDTRSDLAVIKIGDPVKLKVPEFGDSSDIVTGETVCAIGCPNGHDKHSTVTAGIISVPKVRMSVTSSYSSNFIQTDTPINPGNSGGALVNSYGQVVGIVSSKISGTSYEGVGFAIPTRTVKKVVASLIDNGYVASRSRIGLTYRFISSATAEIDGYESVGLLVDSVTEECSLHGFVGKDDIITHVNDIPITDDAILLDMLEDTAPGKTLTLTVLHKSGVTKIYDVLLLSDEGTSGYIAKDTEDK